MIGEVLHDERSSTSFAIRVIGSSVSRERIALGIIRLLSLSGMRTNWQLITNAGLIDGSLRLGES